MEILSELSLKDVLFFVAVFSTLVFGIKIIFFVFGGGLTEVCQSFDVTFESDYSFDFFSTQSILAFLMGFSWFTLSALYEFNLALWISVLVGIACGVFFMFISSLLLFFIKKLNKELKADCSDLVGQVAKTYTRFHPKSEGQIQIEVHSKLATLNAVNMSDKEIDSFKLVKVVKVEKDIIYIEEIV